MSRNSPLPAIDPNALGTQKSVLIDALLLPYIIEALSFLTDPNTFYGDSEDIQGTVEAFENLMSDITDTAP